MKTRAEDLEDAVKEALQMLARGRPADAQETLSAALDAPTSDRAVRRVALEEARTILDEAARIGGEERWGTGAETPLVGRLASLLTAAKPIEPWRDPSFMGAMAAKQGLLRDAALEEAAHLLDETERLARAAADEARAHVRPNTAFIGEMSHAADVLETQAQRIRAMQSAPAQVVSVAKVREVLADVLAAFRVIGPAGEGGVYALKREARRLGVDLDAAPAPAKAYPGPMCWKDCGAEHPVTTPCPAKPLPPTACGEIVDGEPCRRWDGHEGVCDSEGSR